jgi:hypothetical protein
MEGFTISMMSVLIGISAVNSILISLSETSSDAPIILTMQNTGLSFAFSIYLFSIASCLVVTNYWIITRRRDMAIRKAFGWSNFHLVSSIIKEMAEILFVSLCFSGIMIALLSSLTSGLFSIRLTPFFMLGTLVLLLFTLSVSVIIPVTQILKIHPAEVIG